MECEDLERRAGRPAGLGGPKVVEVTRVVNRREEQPLLRWHRGPWAREGGGGPAAWVDDDQFEEASAGRKRCRPSYVIDHDADVLPCGLAIDETVIVLTLSLHHYCTEGGEGAAG